MLFEHREKWIWSLAEKWVAEHAFSLIEGNPETGDLNGSPLHLIKNVNGEWHYIRITKADYVWPQHMERDMAESTQTMLKKRAQLNYQPVHALYLYVFEQSPPEAVKERIITDQTPQTKNMHFAFAWIDLETQTFKASRDPVPIRQEPIEEMLQREPETLPDIPDIRTRLEQVEQQREKRRQKWFGQSRPNWTYILLGINVIMYLLLSLYGSRDESFNFFTGSTNIETLLQFGAKSGYHIINGEWWRLITPIFLHIGLMHFLFNSIALLSLGSLVEGIFGSKRFVWIYFLSGIAGNVASFVFSDAPGAGASGAIFGAMGAMIYFVLNSKTEWTKAMGRDVIVILGINVIIGFMHPSIDNFAHFGGLIGGFIVAAVFGLPQKPRIIWRSAGGSISLCDFDHFRLCIWDAAWEKYGRLFANGASGSR